MAEFVTKLEGYADLEVSIIRATKINKVLKAILKLNSIPKEEEFQFKTRSQTLLDKWNKLLASEASTPVSTTAPVTAATNGFKEDAKPEGEEKTITSASTETPNGVKDESSGAKPEANVDEKALEVEVEPEEATKTADVAAAPAPSKETTKEAVAESAPVESTA